MKAEPALGYRDDEAGSGGDCGNLCKASLLTLAGFGTLAVVNGLGREFAEIKNLFINKLSCQVFKKSFNSLDRKGGRGGQSLQESGPCQT